MEMATSGTIASEKTVFSPMGCYCNVSQNTTEDGEASVISSHTPILKCTVGNGNKNPRSRFDKSFPKLPVLLTNTFHASFLSVRSYINPKWRNDVVLHR